MSYSFNFTAATKEEAKSKTAAELDNVVAQQPGHAAERDSVLAAVNAFIDQLDDNPDRNIAVSVHGSIGWDGYWNETPLKLNHVSAGINVAHSVPVAQI